MATWERPSQRLPQQQPQVAEAATEGDPSLPTGRELAEANRFAYAALCSISLSQLFPEPEHSSFCTEFMMGLVKWLELSEAVLPTMTAFASGLGGEGADVFVQILLKDPILKNDPLVITQDLLTFSLKDGHYDARARVLVCHMTTLLQVSLEELDILEKTFLESLKETKEEESEMAEASWKKKENRRKWKRYLLIGLATVGGGTVIGVTGGLAAPLVAAGAAAIIGSAGAAALGSVAGIAVMTSLFGAAGAGLTGYKMKKRVGAIEEFTFLPLTEGRQLHITIAITGWLASGRYRTFSAPWAALARSHEQYCLVWEAKYLMELGNALETILSGLANKVAQEALKYTVFSGIVAALTWPASLLAVANVIDNPWGVCLHRSAEVGKHLAHILLSRQQGQRPVTLIGFSLGARVIYFCLQEMAQEKDLQTRTKTQRAGVTCPRSELGHGRAVIHTSAGPQSLGHSTASGHPPCSFSWLFTHLSVSTFTVLCYKVSAQRSPSSVTVFSALGQILCLSWYHQRLAQDMAHRRCPVVVNR
ncbi:transmembrane and coiled-coil domain-containing protein 4 isoform X7 [Loxodonta africana]|uniref:transmembrane and coiled-coil domain-containing protein 4 isoform X7 n=1 Tax=Loxodonta africana TaxID=9785 RepID=UPI0030D32C1C